jgi:hypothetical protein
LNTTACILGLLQPRLTCRRRAREVVALLGAGALLVGCTTTHALGRISDDGVRREVDDIAANGDAVVRLRPLPGARPPSFGERVTGVAPPGLIIEATSGQPLLVAREQVSSLSRYDHARGAADGAIAGSIAGFAVGLLLGILQTVAAPRCSDYCDRPSSIAVGLRAGAVVAAIGAVLGAGIGAAGGHEERFEIAP